MTQRQEIPSDVAPAVGADPCTGQPIGRWPLSDPFPAMLCDLDLRRVTGYGHSWFYILKAKGAFRFLEARPALAGPGRTLYSGHLVAQWARGELGSSRYFQSAAKRGADVVPVAGRRPGRPRNGPAGSPSPVHDGSVVR